MKVSRIDVLTAIGVAAVLALGAGQLAAAEREPLATVATFSDHVSWATYSGAPEMALSVSGPGEVNVTERFAGGTPPSFGLFDAEGNARPDGFYKWELREEFGGVNDRVRDEANGRNTARHDETERVTTQGRTQAGSFSIKNGAIVDSTRVEVKAERPSVD